MNGALSFYLGAMEALMDDKPLNKGDEEIVYSAGDDDIKAEYMEHKEKPKKQKKAKKEK